MLWNERRWSFQNFRSPTATAVRVKSPKPEIASEPPRLRRQAAGASASRLSETETWLPMISSKSCTRPAGVKLDQFADAAGKRARRAPVRRLPGRRSIFERNAVGGIAQSQKGLDHPGRNRLRQLARHDHARDAERAVDAPPAIAAKRQFDKQVSRKQWRLRRAKGAGVPGGLPVGWQKGLETLRGQLALGPEFAVRLGLRHIPPRRNSAVCANDAEQVCRHNPAPLDTTLRYRILTNPQPSICHADNVARSAVVNRQQSCDVGPMSADCEAGRA